MGLTIGRGTLLGTGYISITADTGAAEEKMGLLGKGLGVAAAGFTLVAGAIAGTTMMTSEFNSEMLKTSTQAGASAADVKTLSAEILNMKDAQQGPDQLAESMYHLKSIGLDNVDAMKDLRASSDLAAVGGSNLEATTNALGGAWRSGIKGAQTFAMAAGTVNAIIGAGNMRMEDFVSAIGTGILPAAKTFGVSLTQVGAGLALMTDEGVPAVDAATRLKMSFSLLAAPSNAAAKQLAKIGLTGLEMANTMRSPAGLVGTIQLLKDHLDASGMSLSQQAILLSHAFGGGRSSSAILTMVNNVGVLKGKLDQINSSAAKLPAAVEAQRVTLSAQLKIFESTAEDVGIKVGGAFIGPVTRFVSFINASLLPDLGKVESAFSSIIPTNMIQKSLRTLQDDFGTFLDGLVNKSASGKVTAAIMAPWSNALKAVSSGPGAALAKQLMGQQAPIRVASNSFQGTSSGPRSALAQQLLAQQTPRSLYNVASPGPASARAAQALVGQVPGARYDPASIAPPPDPGPWQKAGAEIRGVITDLETFAGQLAVSMKNIVVAATPTVQFLGVTLLGALSLVAHILSTVVGPVFEEFTNFLSHNQGTVKFFAEVILGGLITKMVILGSLKVATGITNLGTSILTFPKSSVTSLGTAFTALKKSAADFGTAGATIGKNIKNLGSSVASLSSSAWTGAVNGVKNFGTVAKNAFQDTMELAYQAKKGIVSLGESAWAGAVSGAKAVGGALKTAALAAWDWVAGAAAATATAVKQAAIWVAQKAVTLAQAAATGIATAAQWLWDAAMNLNPIGLIIIGITALVGAIIWVATKTDWFQTAWRVAWGAIKTAALDAWNWIYKWAIQPMITAFNFLWDKVIRPIFKLIVDAYLGLAGTIIDGAAKMFGWVPGLGPKLKSAAKAFDSFRDSVNKSLSGIDNKSVNVGVNLSTNVKGSRQNRILAATGGPIQGPGTGTSDSIDASLSNGEHVWTAKEVTAAGGHSAVAGMRKNALANKFANGGPVGVSLQTRAPSYARISAALDQQVASLAQASAQALYAALQRSMATLGGVIPSGQHLSVINAALAAAGVPPPGTLGSWQAGLNTLITRESGWNASAINLTDSNAKAGHPSQGLAQTIPSTFAQYVPASLRGLGITNPIANVAAAVRYIVSRYGNIDRVQQANANLPPQGYDTGGWLMPGATLAVNNTGRPERVVGPHESAGVTIHLTVVNQGVLGNQRDVMNWLITSLQTAKTQGRLRGIVSTGP